jgi:hypothetical protein
VADNLNVVWGKFFGHRTRTLWERFPGHFRALVVETNDPLNMYRVRFKCPDMHDFDLEAEDCPWAVPAFDLGGQRAGRFSHPCIGDWIWITFEKQHPYGPIWTGFATPTRRKYYAYPQIFQKTPLSVNEDGKPADRPNDYDEQYLPKDGRPMAHGWQDRYGNLDIHSSVGFFPEEHKDPPPPPDHDAVQKAKFEQKRQTPEVNDPDKKYMARVTKYGSMFIMSDQGYHWKKDEDGGELGEFEGSFKKDEKYEIKRWKCLQKVLNEGEPKGDHRRVSIMNRYGSKFEMRDTGWAQQGPIKSKSRSDEYGPRRILSEESENDFRWIKLRTKGGMLFQAYDKGFDPEEDQFVKRKITEEMGPRSEKEDQYWKDKDARWMRMVTRHGFKFVLDDRGSDDKRADKRSDPHGNGVLIKGRREPSVKAVPRGGKGKGYFWEFNENDKANHTMWGTPMGLTMEMNDRYQYVLLSASLGKKWARKWEGIKENEFIGKPAMMRNPEKTSHHLKLDHDNEYIRLKTRGGGGPRPMMPAEKSGSKFQQGVEMRDGRSGDGPWTEIVDSQHRGMWWSKQEKLGIWRARKGKKMFIWMDEKGRRIAIYNNEGEITIFAKTNVNIIAKRDVKISSNGTIDMYAQRAIRMEAGGTRLTINGGGVRTNKTYFGRRIMAQICTHKVVGVGTGSASGKVKVGNKSVPVRLNVRVRVKGRTTTGCQRPGGARVGRVNPPDVPKLEPTDRGQTYNEPFEECPRDEIEHPTS